MFALSNPLMLTDAMNFGRSAGISRSFYESLGAGGLEARTRHDWDSSFIQDVAAWLGRPPASVLDAGCGYGRVAVPLAAAGFEVIGIDLNPGLLRAAQTWADEAGVRACWVAASMTEIPLDDDVADVAVCLWSTFNELLDRSEQIAAVREMCRVVRPGGRLLIEGLRFVPAAAEQIRNGTRRGPGAREDWTKVEGRDNPHLHHDEASWRELSALAGLDFMRVEDRPFGGRPRQVVTARVPLS